LALTFLHRRARRAVFGFGWLETPDRCEIAKLSFFVAIVLFAISRCGLQRAEAPRF
jgi:uncharacterized membrane protein YtjA (UPF0391 family)